MAPTPPPVTLSIAGSDSGGGAGIQADLKTFFAFGTFGTTVVTAITAQNTLGVTDVHPVPLETVRRQVEAVALDLPPQAVKTGMLATAPLVSLVADELRRWSLPHYVLDPVMVATSGHRLLDEDAVESVRRQLLPLAAVVTPNIPEAEILTGVEIRDADGMIRAGRRLLELGAGAALVKGGHLTGDRTVDILVSGGEPRTWERPRLETRHTHGTGCTLSAAVAAGLARGRDLETAVDRALEFVARAIRTAPGLGQGHGPLNHFAPVPEA